MNLKSELPASLCILLKPHSPTQGQALSVWRVRSNQCCGLSNECDEVKEGGLRVCKGMIKMNNHRNKLQK